MSKMYCVPNMARFLQEALSSGWEALGTVGAEHDSANTVSCYDYTLTRPTILVLGELQCTGPGVWVLVSLCCVQVMKVTVYPKRSSPHALLCSPSTL